MCIHPSTYPYYCVHGGLFYLWKNAAPTLYIFYFALYNIVHTKSVIQRVDASTYVAYSSSRNFEYNDNIMIPLLERQKAICGVLNDNKGLVNI